MDIRYPVTIEMEFQNFQGGADLAAAFSFFNEQGTLLFASPDFDDATWGSKPRPVGIYRSRCTIPGNLLTESQIRVCAEVSTRHPRYEQHFLEYDSVAFQVVDKGEPGSVRATWGRPIAGVMRPMLSWDTQLLGGDCQ